MTSMGQLVLMAAVLAVAQVALADSVAQAVLVVLTTFSHHFSVVVVHKAIRQHHVREMIYNIVSILLLKRRYLALKKKLAITVNRLVIPVMEMVLNQVLKSKHVINVVAMVKCKSRVIHH